MTFKTFVSSICLFAVGTLMTTTCDGAYQLEAELQGVLPGDPVEADLFGTSVAIDGDTLFIAASGSSPGGTDECGAFYLFEKIKGTWQQTSQSPVTHPPLTSFDLISNILLAARNGWAFIGAPGTPLGTPPENKDFAGSLLIYKQVDDQWNLVQTINSPDGIPGSFFGSTVAYDGGEWAIVSGANTSFVYFLQYNPFTDQWNVQQSVNLSPNVGFVFPSISGTHALFTFPQPNIPPTANGSVFAYELNTVTNVWNQIQVLSGQNTISPPYNAGDFFGITIGMSNDWAVIAAPLDNTLPDNPIAGAVYFYHFYNGTWHQTQKVYSDAPAGNTLFGFGMALSGNKALIGDPGRKVGSNLFQGAGLVYKRTGDTWVQDQVLTDPNGRAYDFFGGAADLNRNLLLIGDDTFSYAYIPPTFPGISDVPVPQNNGRAVLFK